MHICFNINIGYNNKYTYKKYNMVLRLLYLCTHK